MIQTVKVQRHMRSSIDPLTVYRCGKPGAGGQGNHYLVLKAAHVVEFERELDKARTSDEAAALTPIANLCSIHFQNGTIPEVGVNGVTIETLLAICEDRLAGFQAGPYPCRENALALTAIQEAINWLWRRTLDREKAGTEGRQIA